MTYRYSFEVDEQIVSCDTCPCLEYDTGICHLREEMEITDENLKHIYRGMDEPDVYARPASCPLHETEVQRHESLDCICKSFEVIGNIHEQEKGK
jgi:hypothetical protein